jgi:hypothetical protein
MENTDDYPGRRVGMPRASARLKRLRRRAAKSPRPITAREPKPRSVFSIPSAFPCFRVPRPVRGPYASPKEKRWVTMWHGAPRRSHPARRGARALAHECEARPQWFGRSHLMQGYFA